MSSYPGLTKDPFQQGYNMEQNSEEKDAHKDVLLAPSLSECFHNHKFSLSTYMKEMQKEKLKDYVPPEYMELLFSGSNSASSERVEPST